MIECVFQIRCIIDFDVNTMLKFNWSQRKNKTMHGSMKRVLNIKVYTNKSNNKTKVINIVQTKGFRSLDSSVRDLLHYFKNMEWQKYISHCLTIYLALFDKKYSPVIKIVYVFRGVTILRFRFRYSCDAQCWHYIRQRRRTLACLCNICHECPSNSYF